MSTALSFPHREHPMQLPRLSTIIKFCLLSLASLVALPAFAETKLVSVATIWGVEQSGLPHNAFTDLIRFKGRWYVGFREAIKHHGGLEGKGRLRVLRSDEGKHWKSVGEFVLAEGDLRDAKLLITNKNELMFNSAI